MPFSLPISHIPEGKHFAHLEGTGAQVVWPEADSAGKGHTLQINVKYYRPSTHFHHPLKSLRFFLLPPPPNDIKSPSLGWME